MVSSWSSTRGQIAVELVGDHLPAAVSLAAIDHDVRAGVTTPFAVRRDDRAGVRADAVPKLAGLDDLRRLDPDVLHAAVDEPLPERPNRLRAVEARRPRRQQHGAVRV